MRSSAPAKYRRRLRLRWASRERAAGAPWVLGRRSGAGRYLLRVVALGYLAAVLLVPVGAVVWRALGDGVAPVWQAVTTPDALHAFWLSLLIAGIAVPLNTLFGVACAVVLVRHRFPGKRLLDAFIDLPFAISPVVIGLALVLVYGQAGWLGGWLAERGVQVIFSLPGMVLATVFVSLPYVARAVAPVLREVGTEQEEAAWTLGASSLRSFLQVTLPQVRWGVAYGVVLTTARALGEFGAVTIVSGRLAGQTETLTLYVENRFQAFDLTGAYAASLLLAALALLVLLAMTRLQKEGR
jgi:sulfate/thiosulfate transport system permease protein